MQKYTEESQLNLNMFTLQETFITSQDCNLYNNLITQWHLFVNIEY